MSLKENNRKYVLIIGSSNMDLNVYIPRLPKPGETVTGGMFRQFLGGKGANQAVASVRSGANTIFIGKIGTDSFGDQMITRLMQEGIDISYVIRDPEHHSGVAFIIIDENGENMISVAPGANFHLNKNEIIRNADIIRNAKSLVVQMEIPIKTIEEIFKIASQSNVIKILNPAPLKPIPSSLLKNVDIIIPNEGELFRLHTILGFPELKEEAKSKIIKASKDISELGLKYIITTLGAKGCVIYDKEKDNVVEIPAIKVKAIDTVGAGDCFNGVLASKLCEGESIVTAVKYATVAASIKVTRKGAQEGIPKLEEISHQFEKIMK
jgi:ribokinase